MRAEARCGNEGLMVISVVSVGDEAGRVVPIPSGRPDRGQVNRYGEGGIGGAACLNPRGASS
ncbi:hypothetical protein [Lysobacter gummosus]|uniref:hypothetical protein n=1 Tax=Lysobacter gummosus TaxID=262324 RepID=UPI00363E82A2